MLQISIFTILTYSFLACAELWHKHYLTYSVENITDLNLTCLNNGIHEWQVPSLEIVRVGRGKGDIKIYFKNFTSNHILGTAFFPPIGQINLNQEIENIYVCRTIQHEFGHALGLQHSRENSSIMYPLFLSPFIGIQESDKKNLNDLYTCRYDSVTLLNFQTYLKFKGRQYERIDLNTGYSTKDVLWHSSIFRVNTMYRNSSYVIISENKYYEFNNSMHFINEGNIDLKFPNITRSIQAVLTLKNGTIIAFLEDNYLWYNNVQNYQNLFKVFPEGKIQGAFSTLNSIVLIVKDYMYLYDDNFNFVEKTRMCDRPLYQELHCCNQYSMS